MERLEISKRNRILSQQRRANKEITKGIETQIDSFHQLNPWKRLTEYLFFIALYVLGAVIAYFSNQSGVVLVIAIILMGIALNSLPILIHEGLHGLLAKNEHLNHFISFLTGLPILISSTAYQTTHNNHHYELGRKPDFGTYKQHFKNNMFVWVAYMLQLTIGSILYILFIPFIAFPTASNKSRYFIILESTLIWILFVCMLIFVPVKMILIYWFFPLLILNILTNLRGIASHALGDVENIYLSSRTIFCSKIMSIIFLNENYHLEHHLFPRIPSYNLPKTHKLIWDRLPQALYSKSYLDFLKMLFKSLRANNIEPTGIVHPNKMKPKYAHSKKLGDKL